MAAHKTKIKIMDNGIRMIKEKGYENVTVDSICIKCGITRGAFYHHFKSKDDMLMNVYGFFREINMDQILKIIENRSPISQLWSLHEFFVDNTIALGPDLLKRLYIISIENQTTVFPALTAYDADNATTKLAKTIITKGQAEGVFRTDQSAEDMMWLFINGFNSIAIDWCARGGVYNEKEPLRKLFDLVFLNR
ncbi:MAG: TetR/AcrR family transcriptional regulator [Anaerolineales bacterium]|nr:TetR/AcrR family transcriptional regulator [Anaerolineales bacterium]